MSGNKLYAFSLFAGFILILLGAYYKIQDHPGWGDILGTGLLLSLYWYIAGIAGIFRSKTLSPGRRAGWLAAFLLLYWIAGFLWYLQVIRPEIQKNKRDQENRE